MSDDSLRMDGARQQRARAQGAARLQYERSHADLAEPETPFGLRGGYGGCAQLTESGPERWLPGEFGRLVAQGSERFDRRFFGQKVRDGIAQHALLIVENHHLRLPTRVVRDRGAR